MNLTGTGTDSTMIESGGLANEVQLFKPDSTNPGNSAKRAKMEVDSGLTGEWKNNTRF